MINKLKSYGYKKYKKIKSTISGIYFKRKAPRIEKRQLIKDLLNIGLKSGDIILVHSSLKSIGYVIGGANTVIDALLEVIGKEGTLVIPTYSMKVTMLNTCLSEDYLFDLNTSTTNLGAIPSTFLKYKNIFRSIHPTHSVSAIGKYAEEITRDHHKGNLTFGKNSPWSKMIHLGGKIIGIGISLGPTTQYHYVEDIMGDDFPLKPKIMQVYNLKCKNEKNEIIEVGVQPLDPKVYITRIDQKKSKFIRDYFWEIFKNQNVLFTGKIGEADSWIADLKNFCELVEKLACIGITIYSTEKELKNKNLYPYTLIKSKID